MKNDNKNFIIALMGLALVLTSVFAVSIATGNDPTEIIEVPWKQDRETIVVSGSSTIQIDPDEAILTLTIRTESEDADDAAEENADITDDVIDALRKEVDKDNIETLHYRVNPMYKYDYETNYREEVGYEVVHVLEVTTEDFDDVGDLVDLAISEGATSIDNVRFDISEEKREEFYQDVLADASGNARKKAEAIADGLDLTLGKIVSITESNNNYRPYYYATDLAMEAGALKSADTEILPQELELQGYITVEFEIY
ncbi:SIMPL domain-containing protein [archaeon]|nr:SIMPL domain-containing protein [archaeon]